MEVLKIYFKDLLKTTRTKITKWFKEHEYVHYTDEDGERRHIDEMYNNVIPFFMFFEDEEDKPEDTTFMDEMVS